MTTLSIIIISKNEEKVIVPALKTASFANEILLVDTGSTDKTITLARPLVDRIVNTSGHDFSKWRNLGADQARGDWLLYLDADERIPKPLADEILQTIQNPKYDAYTISRHEIMLGKYLAHWGDPKVLRLIKKSALVTWKGKLHEQPEIKGKIGSLQNRMVHLTHRNIDEKVDKTLRWSTLEAELMLKANHPPMKGWRFFRIMFTEFVYRFFKQGLWRDGTEGIIEVIYQMFSRFISYERLWELQHNPSLEETYKNIDKKILEKMNPTPRQKHE